MKTPSKTSCTILSVALLFAACFQSAPIPPEELSILHVYEIAHPQPTKNDPRNGVPSLTDILADYEVQVERIKARISTAIGQPHK